MNHSGSIEKRALCRFVFSVALVFGFSYSAKSQGLNNLWQGGFEHISGPPWGGSDIEFSTGAAVVTSVPDRVIDLKNTSANITNAAGDLLFFSNGVVVGQADGDTMLNGTGLNPSDYTDNWYPSGLALPQAALIIPDPSSGNRFYLFHCTFDDIPTLTAYNLYVTTIDMSMNGGQGAVVQKNQVLMTGSIQPGKLNAVRHGNGRDWWVYSHEVNSDRFWRFLVSPNGIDGPYQQTIGVVRAADGGRTAFSPDGSKFAYYWGVSDLDIFSVDRCSGLLTDPVHIDIDDYDGSAGVAFSPGGRFLYVSSGLTCTKLIWRRQTLPRRSCISPLGTRPIRHPHLLRHCSMQRNWHQMARSISALATAPSN
ncbi:MAG: hypothetical protein ABI599_09100, partial [Flavobacteriales bacterium]